VISYYRLRRRRAELDAAVARKRKLRKWRRTLGDISVYDMVPPFIITGIDALPVPGPYDVYTSSTYFEAPTVVNTQEAWNIIRSSVVNFPLFWNRMY